jgi:hypothetical protein
MKYRKRTNRVTFFNLGWSAGNLHSVEKVSEIIVYTNTKHDFIASKGNNYVLAEYMAALLPMWGNWSVEFLPTVLVRVGCLSECTDL